VLRELTAALPGQDFIYLGDTARLPYGTKSADTVARYSLQCAQALVERGIASLVVACNTASASALGALKDRYPHLPVIGVIEPGASAAVAASRSQHIAVIGTEGTINGGAYQTEILRRNPAARISARACSLFVALAEEGWTSGPVAEAVAHGYLDDLFAAEDGPDTLVLGCTHFPILAEVLRRVLPPDVRIVDSAATTAHALAARMPPPAAATPDREGIEPDRIDGDRIDGDRVDGDRVDGGRSQGDRIRWLATDDAERFARVGGRFFGAELHAAAVEIIDL
jgi:glutamate racemase